MDKISYLPDFRLVDGVAVKVVGNGLLVNLSNLLGWPIIISSHRVCLSSRCDSVTACRLAGWQLTGNCKTPNHRTAEQAEQVISINA